MEFLVATSEDGQGIQELLYPDYFEESIYSKMTYDAVATAEVIQNWLRSCLCFIAKDGNKIVGFTNLNFARTFYKEIEADVEMFVVAKDYRGKGVARGLVDCIVKNAEANEAKIIYTSCLSGINSTNNSLFINLWKKHGFEVLGTVMIRS